MNNHQTNHLLGYPPNARLLILNADDFGYCHAVNAAIMAVLQAGVVRSTSLMVPCPWATHAIHFLKEHPAIPFGVHLTASRDSNDYPWGPVTHREKVPSLVDETGFFYPFERMPEFLAQVRLEQLEQEFRAQIETVLAAGLAPTHLDWHALRIDNRVDLFDLMFRLASEYGLAQRVRGQAAIEKTHRQGLPANDFDFLDSYQVPPDDKAAQYARLMHDLPAGLSEWAVHPAFDSAEYRAIDPIGIPTRQSDADFWTSPQAKALVEAEGIILLDYRPLQAVWREK